MKEKTKILSVPCLIFAVFFANVIAGAAGLGVFLSDLGEMLTLFAACTAFVIATLYMERTEKGSVTTSAGGPPLEEDEHDENHPSR